MADQAEKLEETSLSEDLEASIDMLEGGDEEEGQPLETVEKETAEEEVLAEEAEEQGTVPDVKPQSPYKAPIDWSPTLKQDFKNLPENVQKAIYEREQSVNNLMQQTAQERRTAQSFNHVVNQFRGLMAAEGIQDPLQGIQGLLTTTAQLAMGSKQQRAKKIADLIQHYGVDIETLDSMLAGQYKPNAEEDRLQQLLDQRMQPVNELINQMNQQRAYQVQQVQSEAYGSIHEFAADPKNEFFEDVRLSMADFLDLAASRNQHMTLQEAYDRACALHPEISQIIAQRPGKQERIAQKSAAASSVSGRRVADKVGSTGEDLSIRDALERSFSDAERRI